MLTNLPSGRTGSPDRFGYVFSSVAGYTIEVQQAEDRFWRSDDQPSLGFSTEVQNEVQLLDHISDGAGNRLVACGISVTGDLTGDVLKDLKHREGVEAAIFLRPAVGLGMNAFQSAGDVCSSETWRSENSIPTSFASELREEWSEPADES